jgi:hypothetical protein
VPEMPQEIQRMVAQLDQERKHEQPDESMLSAVSFGTVTDSQGLERKNKTWAKLKFALLKFMYDFSKKLIFFASQCAVTGGTIDFRSKCREPTVSCIFKIENFGFEYATPPLKRQYGKEWSSKISGTGFFPFAILAFFPGLLQ